MRLHQVSTSAYICGTIFNKVQDYAPALLLQCSMHKIPSGYDFRLDMWQVLRRTYPPVTSLQHGATSEFFDMQGNRRY